MRLEEVRIRRNKDKVGRSKVAREIKTRLREVRFT